MAANSKLGALAAAYLRSATVRSPAIPAPRATVAVRYSSTAEDVVVVPPVVPEGVIGTGSGETKYWVPHPETGVFVPDAEEGAESAPDSAVLEETVWVRDVEDVDKELDV